MNQAASHPANNEELLRASRKEKVFKVGEGKETRKVLAQKALLEARLPS